MTDIDYLFSADKPNSGFAAAIVVANAATPRLSAAGDPSLRRGDRSQTNEPNTTKWHLSSRRVHTVWFRLDVGQRFTVQSVRSSFPAINNVGLMSAHLVGLLHLLSSYQKGTILMVVYDGDLVGPSALGDGLPVSKRS
jgi:hypothetical protein